MPARLDRTPITGRSAFAILIVALVALVAPGAHAQPMPAADLPPDLAPWVPWVRDGLGDEACTKIGDARACAWPGRLAIEADAKEVRFELDVVTERRTNVALPGGRGLWPTDVQIGTVDAVVLADGDTPVVTLAAGRHTLRGRIPYEAMPEVLPLPPRIGLVALQLRGADAPAKRDEAGGLWLTPAASEPVDDPAAAAAPEKLEIEVFRKIEDGSPTMVTTFLKLKVAGKARDVDLGRLTLAGGTLIDLQAGTLALRAGEGGSIRAQLRAGEHAIQIREVHQPPPPALKREPHAAPWPEREVWVFAPDLAHRQVELSGALPLDPSRTNLPADLRSFSTFQVGANDALTMKTLRRGVPEPPPAKLKLTRTIWVDPSGDGYTVLDRFSGTMGKNHRLDFLGEGDLGAVATRGGPQLITLSDAGRPGVEVRDPVVSLDAEWRGHGRLAALPAVGWSTDLDQLETTVELPPGWELLSARGTDAFGSDPLERWRLLDLVLLAVASALVARATRPVVGVAAAVGLVLAHPANSGLPWWLGLSALSVWGAKASGESALAGPARTVARGAAIALGVALLAFGVAQARAALFPETLVEAIAEQELEERETEQAPLASADNKEGGTGTRAKGEEGSMGNPNKSSTRARYGVMGPADTWGRDDGEKRVAEAASEVVQTGHGLPRWTHQPVDLVVQGPVEVTRRLDLVLLGPTEGALLALVRTALLAFAAGAMAKAAGGAGTPPRAAPTRGGAAASVALGLLVVAAAAWPGSARAEIPSDAVLKDLRERIVRPAACTPNCVSVTSLAVRAEGRTLTLEAEVHAGALVAYQLPGSSETWLPRNVSVDGKDASALILESGVLHLQLGPGAHRVVAKGPLSGSSVTLPLGDLPRRVTTKLDGWAQSGVSEGVAAAGAIELRRTADETEATAETPEDASKGTLVIPSWVEIQRVLDAKVTWSVKTTIKRVGATGSPVVVRVPLWPGESVIDAGIDTQGGQALVTLDAGATQADFTSSMAPLDALTLEAPKGPGEDVVWSIRCSAIWRCLGEGLAPLSRQVEGSAVLETFRPWPGEVLTMSFSRPKPAEGRSTTIEFAKLDVRAGEHIDEFELKVGLRTSTGGVQSFQIPGGARVTKLLVNGAEQPPTAADGQLRVTVPPGEAAVFVSWQAPPAGGLTRQAPKVVVGDQITNAVVSIRPPRERDVWWASGPGFSPRAFFPLHLLLFAAVGLLLSRLRHAPLPTAAFVPFAAGLAFVPTPIAGATVAWLFWLARPRRPEAGRLLHNAASVGLVLSTGAVVLVLAASAYDALGRSGVELVLYVFRFEGGTFPYDLSIPTWYVERTGGELPQPWVLATSPWVRKLLLTGWSVLAALLLTRAVRRAWASTSTSGFWRGAAATAKPPREAAVTTRSDPPGRPAPASTSPERPVGEPSGVPTEAPPGSSEDEKEPPSGTR